MNSVVHVHEFVGEIFGKKVESAYCEGLVDAKSEADFYHELEELRKKWSAREEQYPTCEKASTTGFMNTKWTPLCLEC